MVEVWEGELSQTAPDCNAMSAIVGQVDGGDLSGGAHSGRPGLQLTIGQYSSQLSNSWTV